MPDMAATASLAIIALCSQGKFVIESKKDWLEPLNLYTLIIAPPAERKSAVLKHMLIPVHQYETEENNRLEPLIQQNIIEYNALLKQKKLLEDRIAKGKSDKSETRAISSEGGIFDILAGKYSNNIPDIDVFLKAHAGDSIRVDRIGRASNHIESPVLTTLLFVQPNVIESLMSNGTFQGRGLL